MYTPVSKQGLKKYDDLPAVDAVIAAWNEPGRVPEWHKKARKNVGKVVPPLARALNKLSTSQVESPSVEAVLAACKTPYWHLMARWEIRNSMPLLERALGRLMRDHT